MKLNLSQSHGSQERLFKTQAVKRQIVFALAMRCEKGVLAMDPMKVRMVRFRCTAHNKGTACVKLQATEDKINLFCHRQGKMERLKDFQIAFQ